MNNAIRLELNYTLSSGGVLDLWQAFWGAPSRPFWIKRVIGEHTEDAFVEGVEWQDTPQTFTIVDLDDKLTVVVPVKELARGYAEARLEGFYHCNRDIYDIHNPDACFGEHLLQEIVYGKQIWG